MIEVQLKAARRRCGWTQAQAAERLGVSQPYLSLLESGQRPLTPELAELAVRHFGLSPARLPYPSGRRRSNSDAFVRDLAALGYPGFAYVRGGRRRNPASVLVAALECEELDPRVVEALPWLLFRFPTMDREWLVRQAKLRDLQNRLGFVASLARELGESRGVDAELAAALEARLFVSRLAREDGLCEASMSERTRGWLRQHRPEAAARWNLLTNLQAEHLAYEF